MLSVDRHRYLRLISLVTLICTAFFVVGGCRRQSRWDGHTFKVTYTWDGKMQVVSMRDTLSNQEVADPALTRRVLDEGNRELLAWVQADKLKRATGIFHIRFLPGGRIEILETMHGIEGAGSEFIKDPDVTVLMIAAHEGRLDRLEQLVKTGQKVNATDQLGNTALMAAVSSGSAEAVRFLLEQHADVNARNLNGETALALSAFSGQAAIVNELIGRGAILDCANPTDRETLSAAERRRNPGLVSTLKKIGVHCGY
jgi:Ankyrin repeats (3 copies)